MAGYSGTPLPKKLGVKAGTRLALIDAPIDFAGSLTPMPVDVEVASTLDGSFDMILVFCRDVEAMRRWYPAAARSLRSAGGLWIAWPKRASGIPTDLSDGVVRAYGLASGLVDNKVCAVDQVWSALRFVIRVENRADRPNP